MTKLIMFRSRNKTRLSALIILACISPGSHAYLDPGTGGMLIQALLAILVGVGLFFSTL